MLQYRKARPQDAQGIAQVHIASWQTSYKGIVPDEVLDNQAVERREGYWKHITTGSETLHFVLVAENVVEDNQKGEIIGFTSGGKSRQENLPYAGELYTLYLLDTYQQQGIGSQLFRMAIQEFIAEGINSMMLWVLADNVLARQFYEKMGGKCVIEQMITIGGRELLEVAYGWEKLEG